MDAFDTRDGMHDLLVDGAYELSPTATGLLWYMLFHTIYDPGSKLFKYVNPRRSTVRSLCEGTRRSPASVKRGLAELESLGFVKRIQQFGANGYRRQNLLLMTAPDDFCWTYRRRGHRDDAACKEECSR